MVATENQSPRVCDREISKAFVNSTVIVMILIVKIAKEKREEEISSGKESSGTNNNGLSTKDNIGDQMFAVRSHRTGSVDILRLHETVEVSLTRKDWDVFTITPVLESFRARRSAPDESIEEEGLTSAETSIPTTPEFTSSGQSEGAQHGEQYQRLARRTTTATTPKRKPLKNLLKSSNVPTFASPVSASRR